MTAAALALIIKTLNDAHIRYLVVGGVAVIAHGHLRATKDVDLYIELGHDNFLAGLRALESIGYKPHIPVTLEDAADQTIRERWIAEKQIKALKLYCDAYRETPIDVFIFDPLNFDEAYNRGMSYPLGPGVDVPVCGYEDLVKLKLLADRPQDRADLHELRMIKDER